MIYGDWVALHKGLSKKFPTGRPYSEIEAMFSVSKDIDENKLASVSGYAKQWGWNRKTVRRFFENYGIVINYPADTSKKQNQMGQIAGQMRDRSADDLGQIKGQIRVIINSNLYEERDRSRDRSEKDSGQIGDRSGDTTIKPINPKPVKRGVYFWATLAEIASIRYIFICFIKAYREKGVDNLIKPKLSWYKTLRTLKNKYGIDKLIDMIELSADQLSRGVKGEKYCLEIQSPNSLHKKSEKVLKKLMQSNQNESGSSFVERMAKRANENSNTFEMVKDDE
jgi:hypothetical protein